MDLSDPYKVLGVAPDAKVSVIRARYRRLAWQHHPDRGGSTSAMASLNDAWAALRDAARAADHHVERAQRVDVKDSSASPRCSPPLRPVGSDGVLDFGRYAGLRIMDVARYDRNYLLWLARMPVGRRYQRSIAAALEKQPPR